MKAYKIWYNTKNYIHKNSTSDSIIWTEDSKNAKIVGNWDSAVKFFFDELGFDLNMSRPDALHIEI